MNCQGDISAVRKSRTKSSVAHCPFYRGLLIGAGFFFVGIGTLGIFLPLLPSTVFFLLAAACFARSSPKFYSWLLNHPIMGEHIRNYREHRAITLKGKILSLSLLWPVLGYSAFFVVDSLLITLLLLAIGVGVSTYILSLKTIRSANKSLVNR